MSINVHPELEAELRAHAQATGLSVESYIEELFRSRQSAMEELESLALEGLNSGEPIEVGSGFWEAKHRRLEEKLKQSVLIPRGQNQDHCGL